jgi:hypothetical protein
MRPASRVVDDRVMDTSPLITAGPNVTAQQIRDALEAQGIDVTATDWPVIAAFVCGVWARPHARPGYLHIDGYPQGSAAWL